MLGYTIVLVDNNSTFSRKKEKKEKGKVKKQRGNMKSVASGGKLPSFTLVEELRIHVECEKKQNKNDDPFLTF